jgi:hypothetical protein
MSLPSHRSQQMVRAGDPDEQEFPVDLNDRQQGGPSGDPDLPGSRPGRSRDVGESLQ